MNEKSDKTSFPLFEREKAVSRALLRRRGEKDALGDDQTTTLPVCQSEEPVRRATTVSFRLPHKEEPVDDSEYDDPARVSRQL